MKKTLRSAMLSTICMLVVAVMSLTGVTYAWFTQSETADVTGMTMNVAAANGGFMVSKDKTNWTASVDFAAETEKALNPVSTVDAVNFFTAVVDTSVASGNTITATKTTENIWTNTFFAKNTGDTEVTVYLEQGAIFSDKTTTDAKESYKAARIAIFTRPENGDYTLQYIWGNAESNLGVKAEGKITDRLTSDNTNIANVEKLQTELKNCKFTLPGLSNGVEQIIEVKVVVWVEGQDVDCINKNAGDVFTVALDLTTHEPTAQN